jgi:hypothetical protein
LRLRALPVALALLLPVPACGALLARRTILLSARLPRALLELPDLLLHELPRLTVLLRAHFVVTAVRAALPPFRVRPFAACTED